MLTIFHRFFITTIVLLLCACSGNSDDSDNDSNNNDTEVAPVISDFSSSATTISSGESILLSWQLSGGEATSARVNPGDIDVLGESRLQLTPTETTSYELIVSNGAGTNAMSVTVTVEVSDNNAEEVNLVSTPSSVTIESGARFEFTHANPESLIYECSLDQQPYLVCESPFYIRDLSSGVHQFSVRLEEQPATESTFSWQIESVFDSALAEDFVSFTNVIPGDDPDGGSFRVKCEVSHLNYDDALVHPGEQDAAHLHMYLGNNSTNYLTTIDSLASTGEGTCEGSFLNRSGYWMPAMLYPTDNEERPYELVLPFQGDEAPNVYYKSAVDDSSSIATMPSGLRMISGNAQSSPDNIQDLNTIRWRCESWTITSVDDFVPHIPRCEVGDWVRGMVFFPPCWDGENLVSTNHKDHMAYPTWSEEHGLHCPASHPVALPQVQFEVVYEVTADNAYPVGDSRFWRLASDSYDVDENTPGGYSFHADWMLSWHPEIIEAWTEHCVRQGRHCSAGQLGNGWQLAPREAHDPVVPDVIMPSLNMNHHLH
ncbi:DUF1996 domain-containing protein [Pleionea sediminis]|uniref:DUF1996 domain-containing protein n=1 Tax=Pleionea sediminis TaxID=2569479 RepID=UPI0011855C39|nr:DUF1996 domain-containing protein [Pleionea sediminis]